MFWIKRVIVQQTFSLSILSYPTNSSENQVDDKLKLVGQKAPSIHFDERYAANTRDR